MLPTEIQNALSLAVEEVLETMCFAAVLDSTALKPEAAAEAAITAAVQFHGNPSGGFRVSVPWNVARQVGAGFLGLDETEVSDTQADEVICELANMICGSVLTRLESKVTFHITHPELIGPAAAALSDDGGSCRWFNLGDGILTAAIHLQPGP